MGWRSMLTRPVNQMHCKLVSMSMFDRTVSDVRFQHVDRSTKTPLRKASTLLQPRGISPPINTESDECAYWQASLPMSAKEWRFSKVMAAFKRPTRCCWKCVSKTVARPKERRCPTSCDWECLDLKELCSDWPVASPGPAKSVSSPNRCRIRSTGYHSAPHGMRSNVC